MKKKLFSIITVCYNAVNTIEKTILSVKNQTFQDLEHIIIDGASTDGTLDIIDAYKDEFSVVISEPDKGLYDAMNKGLRNANGRYIQFLNADDFYTTNMVLETVFGLMKKEEYDFYHGNTVFVEKHGVEYKVGGFIPQDILGQAMKAVQPALFVNKSIYLEKIGLFNLDYSISSDFDMALRLFKNCNSLYVDVDVLYLNAGGLSDLQKNKCLSQMYGISKNYVALSRAIHFYLTRKIKLILKNHLYKPYIFLRKMFSGKVK